MPLLLMVMYASRDPKTIVPPQLSIIESPFFQIYKLVSKKKRQWEKIYQKIQGREVES